MIKKSIALISILLFSEASLAYGTGEPFYPEPYLNSGVQIVDVVVNKTVTTSDLPDTAVMPMIPPDHVLVGLGMFSCSATICGVWLYSRPIIGKGVLGAVELHKFGISESDANLTPELELKKTDTPIAIVGIGARVASDDVVRIDLTYRNIGSDGKLSANTSIITAGNTDPLDKSVSVSNTNQVITGVGPSQAKSTISSLWIYEGTYLQ